MGVVQLTLTHDQAGTVIRLVRQEWAAFLLPGIAVGFRPSFMTERNPKHFGVADREWHAII